MPSEKAVESAVVRWARKHDIWAWKLTVAGWAGLPDRLFIYPDLTLVFIEFKAQNKKLRPLQRAMIHRLKKRGFTVFTMDNKEDAIRVLSEYL